MGLLGRTMYVTAISLVLMSVLMGEVDAKQRIARGRKAITRTYYTKSAVPAWGIILIVGACLMLVGGIFYAILKKVLLGGTNSDTYDPNAA